MALEKNTNMPNPKAVETWFGSNIPEKYAFDSTLVIDLMSGLLRKTFTAMLRMGIDNSSSTRLTCTKVIFFPSA
jgi:hypothetical protein